MHPTSLSRFASGLPRMVPLILASLAVLLLHHAAAPAQESAVAPEVHASASGQPDGPNEFLLTAARTDSPRHTLASFLRLGKELEAAVTAFRHTRDRVHAERIGLISDELVSLIDLSQVSVAARRETGDETLGYLLDIFGRIALPNLADVPDVSAFGAEEPANYTIPDTPLSINRIESGPREGEFLFSERTVRVAPRFYRGIESLPLRTSLPISSWNTGIRQFTGPLIPSALASAVPDSLQLPVLGTPAWKIFAVVLCTTIAAILLGMWHWFVSLLRPKGRVSYIWLRILSPLAVILVVFVLQGFFSSQINIAGRFSRIVDSAAVLLTYLGWTWAFWLLVIAFFEWVVLTPKFPEGSLDSSMLRLVARIIGCIGGLFILAYAANNLGLPVFSLVAGLGIGGLAIALAIRPTLENLIGGFILFLDRPIRVGDFCTFGSQSGTVESIGVRSTSVRALDRTLITIPNAQFADMQIVNWAQCDEMLIEHTIGLRYETDSDQLRYVLARIREMFHGHPRIDGDTVRVRFEGYGASSLDLSIRVYAKTREWNDFYAIKEDVLLRIKDIVAKSGSSFAFPSQTLYFARDDGLDTERGENARKRVAEWRRSGQLPFPRFSAAKLQQLDGRISYPPYGSPEHHATGEELAEFGEERLSAGPLEEEVAESEPEEKLPKGTSDK